MRVLELFSGIGGWRFALPPTASVVAAYDMSPAANATYALNHGGCPRPRELATIPLRELVDLGADTWVLSPPCQPYCRMGLKADLADARARAFLRLLEILAEAPPERLVLENVPFNTDCRVSVARKYLSINDLKILVSTDCGLLLGPGAGLRRALDFLWKARVLPWIAGPLPPNP